MTWYLVVADEKAKSIPIGGRGVILNSVDFYIWKGMPYSEELQDIHKSTVLNWN